MAMNTSDYLDKLKGIIQKFRMFYIMENSCLTLNMSSWVQYYVYVAPLLVAIAILVNIFIVIVFVKARIFGTTQKWILACMTIDNIFMMGMHAFLFRLTLLNELFGYVKYSECRINMAMFNTLYFIHGTSMWLKTYMAFQRVLVLGFPLKMKEINFPKIVGSFFVCHSVIGFLSFIPNQMQYTFTPLNAIQIKPGSQLFQIIQCCVLEPSISGFDHASFGWVSIMYATVYVNLLPNMLTGILTLVLMVQIRNHMKRLASVNVTARKRSVPYILVTKVSIVLSISYTVQQVPFFTTFLQSDIEKAREANSMWYIFSALSSNIAKPIEFLIYLSLSEKFRRKALDIIFCRKETASVSAVSTKSNHILTKSRSKTAKRSNNFGYSA